MANFFFSAFVGWLWGIAILIVIGFGLCFLVKRTFYQTWDGHYTLIVNDVSVSSKLFTGFVNGQTLQAIQAK